MEIINTVERWFDEVLSDKSQHTERTLRKLTYLAQQAAMHATLIENRMLMRTQPETVPLPLLDTPIDDL